LAKESGLAGKKPTSRVYIGDPGFWSARWGMDGKGRAGRWVHRLRSASGRSPQSWDRSSQSRRSARIGRSSNSFPPRLSECERHGNGSPVLHDSRQRRTCTQDNNVVLAPEHRSVSSGTGRRAGRHYAPRLRVHLVLPPPHTQTIVVHTKPSQKKTLFPCHWDDSTTRAQRNEFI